MLIVIMGPLGRAPFNSISKMAEDKKREEEKKDSKQRVFRGKIPPFFCSEKKKCKVLVWDTVRLHWEFGPISAQSLALF